jgi:hypothetical protein
MALTALPNSNHVCKQFTPFCCLYCSAECRACILLQPVEEMDGAHCTAQ